MQNSYLYVLLALLVSCAGDRLSQSELEKLSAKELMQRAQSHTISEDVRENIYETLISIHPKTSEAKDARLKLIDSMIKQEEYDDAINEASVFLLLYPEDDQAVRAYRLIAESYRSQYEKGLEKHIKGFLIQHDLFFEAKLIDVSKKIIELYPGSDDAKWAEKQLKMAEENEADYFLQIARFYLKKGNKEAAIARATWVIEALPHLSEKVKEAQEIVDSQSRDG